MGTITVTSKKLFTLKPDGTELKELNSATEWGKNRIGEYKKIEVEFTTTQALADSVIYFTPALFLNYSALSPFAYGGIPSEAYVYVVDASATIGTYDMAPLVNPPYSPNLPKNWEVKIYIGYGNDFKITMKFYHLEDQMSYFGTTNQYNPNKLLNYSVLEPNILLSTSNNVYNTGKYGIKGYVYQVDPASPSTFSYREFYYENYAAGFYEKNETETAPYFTNPVWVLEDSNGTISTISSIEDTKVNFSIDSASAPTNFFLWAIRTNNLDNSVDFKDNYEASFAEILSSVSTSTRDNKIKGPSDMFVFVSGTTYTGYAYLDKTQLEVGDKYRFIAVVYDNTGFHVNSFISEEYEIASPSFNGIGYTMTAKLRDYFNEFTGNELTCAVEERMQSIVNINYDYNGFSDDILQRLGLTVANDIRRYLVKVTAEIYYNQSSQLRHVLQRSEAFKLDPVTYSSPSGLQLNFTNYNLEVIYSWRNRYEDNIPNLETYFNGNPVTPSSDQDWAGRTIYIATKFELYYDDYPLPFTDEIVFTQIIKPKDYNTKDLVIYKTGTEKAFDPDTEFYCNDETVCLDAYYSAPAYADYRLITNIEKETGNIATIEESEQPTGLLTKLTTTKIINQESAYGQTTAYRAKFCVDPAEVQLDNFYKLSVMAKKLVP